MSYFSSPRKELLSKLDFVFLMWENGERLFCRSRRRLYFTFFPSSIHPANQPHSQQPRTDLDAKFGVTVLKNNFSSRFLPTGNKFRRLKCDFEAREKIPAESFRPTKGERIGICFLLNDATDLLVAIFGSEQPKLRLLSYVRKMDSLQKKKPGEKTVPFHG